jgi:hypothetical protein
VELSIKIWLQREEKKSKREKKKQTWKYNADDQRKKNNLYLTLFHKYDAIILNDFEWLADCEIYLNI